MSIHEAKTMGEVMDLVCKVESRAEGRRFVMEYLEAAPDLTEEKVRANIRYGIQRWFDGDQREVDLRWGYFSD